MRPKTIVYFERIIFGTLLLGVLEGYLMWDRIIVYGDPPDRNLQTAINLAIQIFGFALVGTLTLLVSRRRSKIAMWISIALFAMGLPAFVEMIIRGQMLGSNIIAVLQGIGQAVALGLLLTPSARRWMRREDKLLEVFH